MARRGPQDAMEIIIVLVCLGFLFFGNLDRISKTYFYNPNYPYYDKYPDFPYWCSGMFILVIAAIVLSWFAKRD
jgi:hypothetical protein